MAGTVQIEFRHPEDFDLVFFYLETQMQAFDDDGIERPEHRILVGEDKVIVELKMKGNEDWPIGPTDNGAE
jgi:hypothetical protein